MWLDSRTDYLSNSRADCCPDGHRNALTFGKPIAERERLTKPD
jgi:hypothetical protein